MTDSLYSVYGNDDPDGNTTAIAPVKIAILGANTNLVFSDIQIIA